MSGQSALRELLEAAFPDDAADERLLDMAHRRTVRRIRRARIGTAASAAAAALIAVGIAGALRAPEADVSFADRPVAPESPAAPAPTRVPEAPSTANAPAGPAVGAPVAPGAPAQPAPGWDRAAARLPGRDEVAAAWTGSEMFVWGGLDAEGRVSRDGARWRAADGSWHAVPTAPTTGRVQATAVWTGKQVIVWGGLTDRASSGGTAPRDGAMFDPVAGVWTAIPQAPVPGRSAHAAVWTGRELLVWGGEDARDGAHADGAAFNPATGRWRTLAPSPLAARSGMVAVWTGRELLIWGGAVARGLQDGRTFGDGASYDPATDRWRALPEREPGDGATAVWTGSRMLVFGGMAQGWRTDLVEFDPTRWQWRTLRPASYGPGAYRAVWTGDELLAWRTMPAAAEEERPLALAYRPATDTWVRLAAPPREARGEAIWAGDRLVVCCSPGSRLTVHWYMRGAESRDMHTEIASPWNRCPPPTRAREWAVLLDPPGRASDWDGRLRGCGFTADRMIEIVFLQANGDTAAAGLFLQESEVAGRNWIFDTSVRDLFSEQGLQQRVAEVVLRTQQGRELTRHRLQPN